MHKQRTQIQAFLHLKMHPSSRSRWVGCLRCTKPACIVSLALCLVAPTISTAQTLIRCPDWKSYLQPQPVLNKVVKRDFDKKLATRVSPTPKPAQKPLDLMAAFRKPPAKSNPKPPTKTAKLNQQKTKRATPAPKAITIPVWKARKGTYLIDAVQLWATRAGYQTVIAHKGDWKFQINYAFEGSFKTNLKEVVKGFGTSGLAPKVTIYGNKVIKIGTR